MDGEIVEVEKEIEKNEVEVEVENGGIGTFRLSLRLTVLIIWDDSDIDDLLEGLELAVVNS